MAFFFSFLETAAFKKWILCEERLETPMGPSLLGCEGNTKINKYEGCVVEEASDLLWHLREGERA